MNNGLVDFPSGIARLENHLKSEYEGRFDNVPGLFALMCPLIGALKVYEILAGEYDPFILSQVK